MTSPETRCPLTYEPCTSGAYSRAGLHRLSARLQRLHPLAFTTAALRREAVARAAKMSIQGMQPKVSAVLRVKAGRFDLLDRSFLSPVMRTAYREVLQARAGLLRL